MPTPKPRRGNRRGERGSITVEMVLVTPALLLLLVVVVQAGLYAYAKSAVGQAADDGAAAAARFDSTAGAGKARVEALLAAHADRLLTNRTVTVTRGAATVHVRVDAAVLSMIPGLHWQVRDDVTAPVERFTTQ